MIEWRWDRALLAIWRAARVGPRTRPACALLGSARCGNSRSHAQEGHLNHRHGVTDTVGRDGIRPFSPTTQLQGLPLREVRASCVRRAGKGRLPVAHQAAPPPWSLPTERLDVQAWDMQVCRSGGVWAAMWGEGYLPISRPGAPCPVEACLPRPGGSQQRPGHRTSLHLAVHRPGRLEAIGKSTGNASRCLAGRPILLPGEPPLA